VGVLIRTFILIVMLT